MTLDASSGGRLGWSGALSKIKGAGVVPRTVPVP
jgi:hypothetical protein